MDKDTCYICSSPAVSKEHVPPKCIFPEKKDIGTDKYRQNLITVPSCALHNSAKSDDDEFLMVSLAGMIGNNTIGYTHSITKIPRALKRRSRKLLDKIFLKKMIVDVEVSANAFTKVIIGKPDTIRLENSFRHIAYGVYYHHFKKCFDGEIKVHMNFLFHLDTNTTTFKNFVNHKFNVESEGINQNGDNPDVFYYQFVQPDIYNITGMRVCFYNNINIYFAFIPKGWKQPFDLGMELLNSGMHTIIEVEGKKYEFNKNISQ